MNWYSKIFFKKMPSKMSSAQYWPFAQASMCYVLHFQSWGVWKLDYLLQLSRPQRQVAMVTKDTLSTPPYLSTEQAVCEKPATVAVNIQSNGYLHVLSSWQIFISGCTGREKIWLKFKSKYKALHSIRNWTCCLQNGDQLNLASMWPGACLLYDSSKVPGEGLIYMSD